MRGSVNEKEIANFAKQASKWWINSGEYSLLLRMNRPRIKYIRQFVNPLNDSAYPLHGKKILDIGCGGGFLTESLARLGASVLAADATAENIEVAKSHLPPKLSHLVTYMNTTAGI